MTARKAAKPVKKVAKKRAPVQVSRQTQVTRFMKEVASVLNDYVHDAGLRARLFDALDLPNQVDVAIVIRGMEAFDSDESKMADDIADALGILTEFDEIIVDDIYPS